MLGVFAMWLMGIITWMWPRLTGREWYSRALNSWHYWLTMLGVLIMFFDLVAGGLVHGFMFKAMAPWMDIVEALKPFWGVRTFAGAMIVAGQVLWAWNLYKTAHGSMPYDASRDIVQGEEN
jgi:cytochrome c oxidase cbb3-type subunit 1